MIKAYIFDLDGTLLDRDSSLKKFINDQYERLSPLQMVDKNEFISRFIQLDNRGYVWKDKVYSQLITEFDIAMECEDLLEDYIYNFRNHCIGFHDLHETLQFLMDKGVKLGMITNGFGEFQLGNIKALGIEQYFQAILISEVEGLRKPDKEIFKRALDRLGVSPEEAFYIGDHPENDIKASRNTGLKAIWKEDLYYPDDFDRDETIKELKEIQEIFEAYSK